MILFTPQEMKKRQIEHSWQAGFCNAKLVNYDSQGKAFFYVAKYLFKQTSRVRASSKLGIQNNSHNNGSSEASLEQTEGSPLGESETKNDID